MGPKKECVVFGLVATCEARICEEEELLGQRSSVYSIGSSWEPYSEGYVIKPDLYQWYPSGHTAGR